MMRTRRHLDNLLREGLPGFEHEAGSHGRWQCAGRPASWALYPGGPGFWLVLQGDIVPERAPRELLNPVCGLPWPLKAVRRQPGTALSWQAELYLRGDAGEPGRLRHLVEQLARSPGEREEVGGAGTEEAPPDWGRAVEEAAGAALEQGAGGVRRMLLPDGPAVELRDAGNHLAVRCLLARTGQAVPAEAVPVLEDLLAVANGRTHGCRAVLDDTGAAWLEGRMAWGDFACGAVARLLAVLAEAARDLARPCQALAEIPAVVAAYQEYMLGLDGKAVA